MGDGQPDELRYTAFLSYSHKDAAAAGRLHRRLETYRMPKRLVGTETARGRVPARLAPIFRDREELPAATDLSTTVREALAQSGALIVLCSPAAAASLWVAEEIETFRKLHPDRPVLAAVLDGDPPDCFPQVLRALGRDGTWHEPLATDLRRHCDGPRLGLLKLVAGITGIGLDALVQRDAARRIRRVMAVTGAALVAMLAMAALALVAINARGDAERQRAEAERQRAAAEGQIEFMLTDLRTRLRGSVGQLEVMAAVNRQALRYYDAQNLDSLSADSLERRARVLIAIGEDDVSRGNLVAALGVFRMAHLTTASLLERSPDDPARIFSHGQSEYWVGRIHELRRNWPGAELQYRRYAGAAERLIQIAPDNPDYMMEVGWGAYNLGNIQLNGTNMPALAAISYEKAAEWFARAAAARPRDMAALREQANALSGLANSYLAQRLPRRVLNVRQRQFSIMNRLREADPGNFDIAFRLAVAQRALARAYGAVGSSGPAVQLMSQAYDGARRLTAQDSRNAEWLLFQTMVQCDLYFGRFGLPAGVDRAQLRSAILVDARTLATRDSASLSDISPCLAALSWRRGAAYHVRGG